MHTDTIWFDTAACIGKEKGGFSHIGDVNKVEIEPSTRRFKKTNKFEELEYRGKDPTRFGTTITRNVYEEIGGWWRGDEDAGTEGPYIETYD